MKLIHKQIVNNTLSVKKNEKTHKILQINYRKIKKM